VTQILPKLFWNQLNSGWWGFIIVSTIYLSSSWYSFNAYFFFVKMSSKSLKAYSLPMYSVVPVFFQTLTAQNIPISKPTNEKNINITRLKVDLKAR
jgi:hypothetical protein